MRVLVVEDSRLIADAVVEGLRDQGMAVDVAYNGLEAAAKLNLNPYDVVVLDRDLPGTTRRHAVPDDRRQRATGDGPDADRRRLPGERVAGLALGADDYLPKPFHFPELVLRVRALARRKPTARSRTCERAGIELDSLTRAATRNGRQLELSAKEFAVLEALLKASSGRAQCREPPRTGMGRKRRPLHQDRAGHDGQTQTQARRPTIIRTIPSIGYRSRRQPKPTASLQLKLEHGHRDRRAPPPGR